MNKKDIILKKVLSNNERFASIINNYFFEGKEVVDPKKLEDGNIEYTVKSEDGKYVNRIRDLIKSATYKLDDKNGYLLIGIENQTVVDKLMPFRVMLYDALTYDNQISIEKHQKDVKIKLKPVITLVIYYGKRKWNNIDLISNLDIDENIKKYVSNYKMNLLSISEINDDNLNTYTKDIRQLFKYIKMSNNKNGINSILSDEDFNEVKKDIIDAINILTNSNIEYEEGDDEINMCKGLKEFREEAKQEGIKEEHERMCKGLKEFREEAKQEGIQEGQKEAEERNIKTMHSNGATVDMIAKLLGLDINYVKLILSK